MDKELEKRIDAECERRGYDPLAVRALLLTMRVAKMRRFMREHGHTWEYDVQIPGYEATVVDMSRWTRVSFI